MRVRRSDRSRWERRVLAYARFFAESALEPDFFARLAEMLKRDFPDFIAIASYDERGLLVPESSIAMADERLWKLYVEEYSLLNPFPRVVATHDLHDQTVIFDHWIDTARLRKSVFFNDFMRKLGGEHALGASIAVPGWGRSALSFYRGGAEFDEEDARRVDDLRPFTKNALMLRSLWNANPRRRSWRDRIEALGRPVISDSPEGAVEPLNAAGERLLRDNVRRIARNFTPIGVMQQKESHGETVVSIAQRPDLGLTRRECDVVAALRRGLSVAEIADSMRISPNTVRTFLKSIYPKVGVHSSLQLIARLNELDSLYGHSMQSA
jgi:DNA-binding CsgD family transcriptional regulator